MLNASATFKNDHAQKHKFRHATDHNSIYQLNMTETKKKAQIGFFLSNFVVLHRMRFAELNLSMLVIEFIGTDRIGYRLKK